MVTIRASKIKFIEALREKDIVFFSSYDVRKIFSIKSENTLKQLLVRVKKEGIIEQLARNKYLFLHSQKEPSDFQIANFLVIPSYLSLESALSFHGFLEQFPYRITSITLAKPREIKIRNKIFSFSQIKKEYFKDFEKRDDFLIASKEKALFDYLYFAYKGLRSQSSLEELTVYLTNKSMKKYLAKNADKKLLSFLNQHVKL